MLIGQTAQVSGRFASGSESLLATIAEMRISGCRVGASDTAGIVSRDADIHSLELKSPLDVQAPLPSFPPPQSSLAPPLPSSTFVPPPQPKPTPTPAPQTGRTKVVVVNGAPPRRLGILSGALAAVLLLFRMAA